MKGRTAARLLAPLLILFLLTACSEDIPHSSYKSNSSPTVTLTFISSWGGNDTKADAMQQILDGFCAANPNIKVNNDSIFGDDFLTSLKTAMVSGDDPDVFGLWPGSDINRMIAAGKVADLSGMLSSNPALKKSFGSDMWQYVTVNGKTYGLPVEIIFEGLFINRDLFDRYQIKVPSTFDELMTAVAAFKKQEIIPIAFNCTPEGSYFYQNLAASIGGKNAIEHPFAGGTVNPCYLEAMDDMQQLFRQGAFTEDEFTLDSNARNELFRQKKAAMIVQGSWYVSEVESDPDVQIIPFPGKTTEYNMVYGLGNGVFHISSKAWNDPAKKQAAIKLLKYIVSKKSCALLANCTGMLSNVDLSGENVQYGRLTRSGLSLIGKAKELIGPPDSYISRAAWENIVVKNFPYMLQGKIKPQDIWDQEAAAGGGES